ncbi:hypothetical protein RRF68_08010 [Tenacibaculum sp. HL-MS23]|uniref:hypothetical protein n=1 Tax=Tenacibaculum sp. HL-MS23 TaxID=3077734 RepID=UPI0028FC0FCB|nr:hypothetical protein [Tenacibaculum sp. HL-MS23]WNW00940.1 hypothetical protein RRF68_08010 [Tenacibaculum sp. HL-MS23]
MKRTSYKKYRTIHLPKVIVDNLLLKLHLGFADFDYNLEVFFSIINEVITKSSIYNKQNEKYLYQFIPLDSRFLKTKYGNSYSNYIRFLVNQGIIWNDNYYAGKTTYYYLHHIDYYIENTNKLNILYNINKEILHSPYCFQKGITITYLNTINNKKIDHQKNRIYNDWYQIKILIDLKNKSYLTSSYEKDSVFINNAPKHIKKMGSHFRKYFKLHHEEALRFIENQYRTNIAFTLTDNDSNRINQKYTSRLSSVLAIHNGKINKTLKFSKNKANNRIDTNLTFLASELRQFIVGYEDMVYLDLKNSQPVMLNIVLKEHYKDVNTALRLEIEDYCKHTTQGVWYERLQELYGKTRDECKDIWMCIAYSKNENYLQEKNIFKKCYPGINAIIEYYKKKNHADFSVKLTKIESSIFIDGICRELVNQGIIPFTVHDAVIVPKKDKEKTLEIMRAVLKKHLGVAPVISEE